MLRIGECNHGIWPPDAWHVSSRGHWVGYWSRHRFLRIKADLHPKNTAFCLSVQWTALNSTLGHLSSGVVPFSMLTVWSQHHRVQSSLLSDGEVGVKSSTACCPSWKICWSPKLIFSTAKLRISLLPQPGFANETAQWGERGFLWNHERAQVKSEHESTLLNQHLNRKYTV